MKRQVQRPDASHLQFASDSYRRVLRRCGSPVARIEPAEAQPKRGRELAAAFVKAVEDVHVGEEEATAWLHDLEQARGAMQPQGRPWRF